MRVCVFLMFGGFICIWLTRIYLISFTHDPNILDFVQLGDRVSESVHNVVAPNTRVIKGGLEEMCRQIEPGGEISFTVRCDPNNQNYLTVKLWGSDINPCMLFLADDTGKRYGNYLAELPEIDLSQGKPSFQGRFYYVTYPIPRELTQGKISVRLKLVAIGSIAPYAPPSQRERPLQNPSRGIYRIYTHTDPFFTPPPDEKQGKPPIPKTRPPKSHAELIAMNRRQINEAIGKLLEAQIYGDYWTKRLRDGSVPIQAYGATSRRLPPPNLTPNEFLNQLTVRMTDGNCADFGIVGVYAKAYTWSGSKFYCNPDLLERIVAALDFFARAQGENGGFTAHQWIGVPNRGKGWSCLEGYGTRWLGRAFLEVATVLREKGLLEEKIDDDCDPKTPPVSRRKVYARMFALHRDYLVREARGHATNQDLYQIQSMWLCNEALRFLALELAWPREKTMAYVYSAIGLESDPLGGFWVSPKGLPLEPWGTLGGGYCGNYGINCVHAICEMAEITGDEKVRQQALKVVEAFSHFFFPDIDENGFKCWRREEVISTRNNFNPGRVDYGVNFYAAAVLRSPVAIRAWELWLEDRNHPEPLDWRNAHFVNMLLGRLYSAPYFEQLLLKPLPQSKVRLFMELGQLDKAWVDEYGHVVVVRHKDGSRLYASLQWRRGFKPGGRGPEYVRVNNIARIHFTTLTIDRIATIYMEAPHGFGKLYICRYGPYFIAINRSEDATFTLKSPPGSEVIDLVSGKRVDTHIPLRLPPLTSIVLHYKAP